MITTILSLYTFQALQTTEPHITANIPESRYFSEEYLLAVSPLPMKKQNEIAPVIQAKAALSIDHESGLTLFGKNANQRLPMASLTKLMTVLIILEENQLEEIATVPDLATKVEGSKMWLRRGEKITISNLVKAALISSANDAALTLAVHNAGSVEKFVEKMNSKAQQFGMENTSFKNPVGLDQNNHYSTAYDLSLMARIAIKNPIIREAVIQKEADVNSVDGKITHKLLSTNELLSSYLRVLGLKTGTTDAAGQCLITVVENEKGNIIVNVILNSPARFQESKVLSDWAFQAHEWL